VPHERLPSTGGGREGRSGQRVGIEHITGTLVPISGAVPEQMVGDARGPFHGHEQERVTGQPAVKTHVDAEDGDVGVSDRLEHLPGGGFAHVGRGNGDSTTRQVGEHRVR
jgi:hypothetical protein